MNTLLDLIENRYSYIKPIVLKLLPKPIYLLLVNLWASFRWRNPLDDRRMDAMLRKMILDYGRAQEALSDFWLVLNKKNINQLLTNGFENFKQTVARNYFLWLVTEKDIDDNPQVQFLKDHLPHNVIQWAKEQHTPKHSFFTAKQSRQYNFITLLLWKYVEEELGHTACNINEPELGNPPALKLGGRLVSQDLAHSLLEVDSISRGVNLGEIRSVAELGAGYGRTAYVLLSKYPHLKYTIIDVPPALYISKRYLSEVLPKADITYIMPPQLSIIGNKAVDLFLAVDCLHEIRLEQTGAYFGEIDRIASYLYFTCWKNAILPYDEVSITERDYPILPNWKKIFSCDRRVQTDFFEAMYQI